MHLLRAVAAIRLVVATGCLIAGLAITECSVAADTPRASQNVARGLEVLVPADAIASPAGFRPELGKPIHYLFQQTRQSLGDAVAGIKLPAPELVEATVVSELGRQGFVRTQVGGSLPQIVILAVVGDVTFKEPPIARDRPFDRAAFRPLTDTVSFGRCCRKTWSQPPWGGASKNCGFQIALSRWIEKEPRSLS